MTKMSIRTGDKVRVIAGKDKGKEGQGPRRPTRTSSASSSSAST